MDLEKDTHQDVARSLRQRALSILHDAVESECAGFYSLGLDPKGNSHVMAATSVGNECGRMLLEAVQAHVATVQTRIREPRLIERRRFLSGTDVFGERGYKTSRFRQMVMDRSGLDHFLRTLVYDGAEYVGLAAVPRSHHTSDFGRSDRMRLNAVANPVRRLLVSAHRLDKEREPVALVVKADGALVYGTPGGERALHEGALRWLSEGAIEKKLPRPVDATWTFTITPLEGADGPAYLVQINPLVHPRLAVTCRLTERQKDVTRLTVRGLSLREVGKELGLSVETCRTHLKGAYAALGCTSRVELFRILSEGGGLDDR